MTYLGVMDGLKIIRGLQNHSDGQESRVRKKQGNIKREAI
jgi:hypothetical protein